MTSLDDDDLIRPIDTVSPASEKSEKEQAEEKRLKDLAAHSYDNEQNRIKKGDYVDLIAKEPTLKTVIIGAGWEQKAFEENKVDADLSVFLLGKDGKTRINEDFVFYNNETALDGAVKHQGDSRTGAGEGDDEAVFLDLNGIPFDIIKIMVVLSIYDEKLFGYHFGQLKDIYVRILNKDDGMELVRLPIDEMDMKDQTAIQTICLVREGPRWFAEGIAAAVKGGLSGVAKSYDIIVQEDTG